VLNLIAEKNDTPIAFRGDKVVQFTPNMAANRNVIGRLENKVAASHDAVTKE